MSKLTSRRRVSMTDMSNNERLTLGHREEGRGIVSQQQTLPPTREAETESALTQPAAVQSCVAALAEFSTLFHDFITDVQGRPGVKIRELLAAISDDKVKIEFLNTENIEGSFYLTSPTSGDSIRFRWGGTGDAIHVYLRGAERREKAFLYVPRSGFDPSDSSYIRRINKKDVQSIDSTGALVSYTSTEDHKNWQELVSALSAKDRERSHLKKGSTTSQWLNRKKIKQLDEELKESDEKAPMPKRTEERIPAEEINGIFQSMSTLFHDAANAFRRRNNKDLKTIPTS